MPLGSGGRYRMSRRHGKTMRLGFRGTTIVEAKNMKTGATHTPAEFAKDRKNRRTLRTR